MIDLSLKEIKDELKFLDRKGVEGLLVELAKLGKQNKRYISLHLSARENPSLILDSFKSEIDDFFSKANRSNYHFAKKSLQAIRRKLNHNLGLVKDKVLQAELLVYFCHKIKQDGFLDFRHPVIDNLYLMQFKKVFKILEGLHEDIKYDFEERLVELKPKNLNMR